MLLNEYHVKAARIVKVNEPLQVQQLQTPKPKGSQILVKVQASGVCHSDVHVWEGYYEGIGGQPLNLLPQDMKKEDPTKVTCSFCDHNGHPKVVDDIKSADILPNGSVKCKICKDKDEAALKAIKLMSGGI